MSRFCRTYCKTFENTTFVEKKRSHVKSSAKARAIKAN